MGQSRTEDMLENMLGADNPLEPPQSRVEMRLANILGADYDAGEPQSRVESLLKRIEEEGVPHGGTSYENGDEVSY